MGDAPVDVEDLKRVQWFMHVMATQCVTLAEFAFAGIGFEADDVEEAIFRPMKVHKSLAKLDILGGIGTEPKQVTLTVPFMVAELSASCPTLTHVKWKSGWVHLDALAVMIAFKRLLDSDLDVTELSAGLARMVAASNLKSVVFEDLPLASGMVNGWFVGMADNKSIRELILRGCLIPLASSLVLMESMQENKTVHTVVLPDDLSRYWLVTRSGRILGLNANRGSPGVVLPNALTVRLLTDVDQQAMAEAVSTLDAVKEAGSAFFAANRTGFVENRRKMLTPGVVRDLEVLMANFLASALAANTTYKQEDLVGGFLPGTAIVLQQLDREQNLHTAAQLSLLNKAAYAHQQSLSEEDARTLQMDRDGRLMQDNNVNYTLTSAVLSGNVGELRQKLQDGEIDWRGQARNLAAASAPDMLVVFDEFAARTDNFVPAPTTKSTTSTTSTTEATLTTTTTTTTTTGIWSSNTASGVSGLWLARGPTLAQRQALERLLDAQSDSDSDSDSDDETSVD
ncbi:hypothetical protein [Hydrogenophaga sp.]|uniref:hypothetical protein n=1 Tax=Hydrogenophaga sp. TaxID=1904254 RepID=UPI00271A5AF8|nr:hypothetical protein [Hydrogenophaga sp.]MDO9434711.1 hypothetical protein [Hydrogenophaga sp.]